MYQTQTPHSNMQTTGPKIALLGILSLVFSFTIFLTVIAPFPLTLVNLICGRVKGLLIGIVLWCASLALSLFVFKNVMLVGVFSLVLVISVVLSEVERFKLSSVKGIFAGGMILITLFSGMTYVTLKDQNLSPKGYLKNMLSENKAYYEERLKEVEREGQSEEVSEAAKIFAQPEVFAQLAIEKLPGYIIASSFFIIWINLILLLRVKPLYPKVISTKNTLLKIKLPDYLIWPVIVLAALMLWGDQLGSTYKIIGETGVKAFGAFYFFQGIGIYIAFLDFAKITGFFRTALVVFTVLTSAYIIALIGLFDMFFNFRKYFKKKQNN